MADIKHDPKHGSFSITRDVRQSRDFVVVWPWVRKVLGVAPKPVEKPVKATVQLERKPKQPKPKQPKQPKPQPKRQPRVLPSLVQPTKAPVPINRSLVSAAPPKSAPEPNPVSETTATDPAGITIEARAIRQASTNAEVRALAAVSTEYPARADYPASTIPEARAEESASTNAKARATLRADTSQSVQATDQASTSSTAHPTEIKSAAELWVLADAVKSAILGGWDLPDLTNTTRVQRVLIAAKIANLTQSESGRYHLTGEIPTGVISVPQVIAALGFDKNPSISSVKRFLRRATPQELELVVTGQLSMHHRQGAVPITEAPTVIKTRGKGRTEYNQRVQIESKILDQLKVALYALSSLPAAADVVRIARGRQTRLVVDSQLLSAHTWLSDFIDQWTRPVSNGHDDSAE